MQADSGERMTRNNIAIETLEQNPVLNENLSVKETIENSLTHIVAIKEEYAKLTKELERASDDKTLTSRLAALGSRLDFLNAWNLSDQIERVIIHFSLKALENKKIATLSGGEKRRVDLQPRVL